LIPRGQVTQARITQAGWVSFWHDLPTLNLASQNTAIANTRVWPAKELTPRDERCGMADPNRDNALDHMVVMVFGNRSGYPAPAIIISPWVAEGGV
jgi:hypothetical protein